MTAIRGLYLESVLVQAGGECRRAGTGAFSEPQPRPGTRLTLEPPTEGWHTGVEKTPLSVSAEQAPGDFFAKPIDDL